MRLLQRHRYLLPALHLARRGAQTEHEDARDERLATKRAELEQVLDERAELNEYWKAQAQAQGEAEEVEAKAVDDDEERDRYNVHAYSGYLWKQSWSPLVRAHGWIEIWRTIGRL